MKWHYWIRQGRKLITHLHTTRMHYTCASNISDNPGFVLPQELCLMTAKNFELLYSFQISLHCSAVIKKHFVRVFVCCRSALTHINKAACWTSSCPPGRRLQHGTWSWHNASKYTKINKIENRNDKKKRNTCSRNSVYVLCCSEMSTKQNCYTWLLYCHILLRLQSMHQFLPAQFRVVPNEPLLAQVLCTHDHFCNHLMLLPTLTFFRFNTTGTVSKLLLIFIHFQCFLRAEYSEQIFFAQ